jgi:alanyl-tRNA synthetase
MNSAELRQSFLDFFASKGHSIVPSAPLLPSSPNLLFTNAGMNQFVPYFLGEREAPFKRAADTQKCIRAGGKHNDLEDVGFDTYHHTFFEMLGNWSFGDYFKKEAIEWSWELLTEVWQLPKERLYATVYQPGEGEPADFDSEAYDYWKAIFEAAGLDPQIHIRYGNKKDNFWMMGETGPCGPCSELHIDLTPNGDSKGSLVNADSPWCIEIWNLVFMEFNAEEDGSFISLPAKNVDTGMGFERVAGIMATTRGFSDFSNPPSNYNSDLFTEIFDHLSARCGHQYGYTMPEDRNRMSEDEQKDCAFRVIADHIRTLSFSVADGILPGNEGRNYVLRRILRRAVMFGKRLNLPAGFFAELAPVVIHKMAEAFPELLRNQAIIVKVLAAEESAFDKTIDRGLQQFAQIADKASGTIAGEDAFVLYDTYGFPLDLTQLLARERSLAVDEDGFKQAMDSQRARGRASQRKTTIRLAASDDASQTTFSGFDSANWLNFSCTLIDSQSADGKHFVITDATPCYAEMGGQIGDCGEIECEGQRIRIIDTIKDASGRFLHQTEQPLLADNGSSASISIDVSRRQRIQRHHSATHLLNWALRTTLGEHIRQAGSYVGPDRLRFDFNHFEALTGEQLAAIEQMVNAAIIANHSVNTYETAFADKPDDVVAVFGEKYGDSVRVVDIGGFSKELCGGTHVSASGEIGLLKIISESGIAAGTRRIEALVGESALQWVEQIAQQQKTLARKLGCSTEGLGERVDALLQQRGELEKQLRAQRDRNAASVVDELIADAQPLSADLRWIKSVVEVNDPNELRALGGQILANLGEGVVILGATFGDKATVVAFASAQAIASGHKAGDIVRTIATALGGKGGGKPDFAMGGAVNAPALANTLNTFQL